MLALLLAITVGVGVVTPDASRPARTSSAIPALPTTSLLPTSSVLVATEPEIVTTTTEPPTTTTLPEPTRAQVDPGNGECANPVVPESVVRRESGCRWDAYNPTGCGGRGCVGFYQLDAGHFAAVSPWNPNVSGGCADLSDVRWEQWAQTLCASRLGPGAWG